MATVQFGYQAPLPNVVRTLKSKDNEEEAKAERRNLLEYHGVFYYHTGEMEHPITQQRVKQGRMIVPLTKVGVQDPKKQNRDAHRAAQALVVWPRARRRRLRERADARPQQARVRGDRRPTCSTPSRSSRRRWPST